jgi:hypothetical protein
VQCGDLQVEPNLRTPHGRLLPGGAGIALAGNSDELPAALAALLLVLYAAAAAAAGWRATLRRDIA